MHARHILADRAVQRTMRISAALEDAQAAIARKIDEALDVLSDEGCTPRGLDGGKERTELCELAARLAAKAVLDACNVPDETRWLLVDRFQTQ